MDNLKGKIDGDAENGRTTKTPSANELRKIGNELFEKNYFDGALRFYERALSLEPHSPLIHLNIAAALLRLERFYEAYGAVEKAMLSSNVDMEKALFRLAKSAYGLRQWQKAIDHFEKLLAQFYSSNQSPLFRQELANAKMRLNEEQTGKYNLQMLYEQSQRGVLHFDVADYTGPVIVKEVPGKGKGLVATENIKKGTLLLVSKAYAIVQVDNVENIVDEIAKKLKHNPHSTEYFYSLYAGDSEKKNKSAEQNIDRDLIKKIWFYNTFSSENTNFYNANNQLGRVTENRGGTGLWLLPSFMNHSCLANTWRTIYGDIMFLHAICDVEKGNELTTTYVDWTKFYNQRQTIMQQKWGFQCQCHLCELDRVDPTVEKERERLMKSYAEIKPMIEIQPQKCLPRLRELIKQMRQSYGDRTELRIHLDKPLSALASLYQMLGQPQDAARVLIDKLECMSEQNHSTDTWMHLAECYMAANKRKQAKDAVVKAFMQDHMKCGITKTIFKKIYADLPVPIDF